MLGFLVMLGLVVVVYLFWSHHDVLEGQTERARLASPEKDEPHIAWEELAERFQAMGLEGSFGRSKQHPCFDGVYGDLSVCWTSQEHFYRAVALSIEFSSSLAIPREIELKSYVKPVFWEGVISSETRQATRAFSSDDTHWELIGGTLMWKRTYDGTSELTARLAKGTKEAITFADALFKDLEVENLQRKLWKDETGELDLTVFLRHIRIALVLFPEDHVLKQLIQEQLEADFTDHEERIAFYALLFGGKDEFRRMAIEAAREHPHPELRLQAYLLVGALASVELVALFEKEEMHEYLNAERLQQLRKLLPQSLLLACANHILHASEDAALLCEAFAIKVDCAFARFEAHEQAFVYKMLHSHMILFFEKIGKTELLQLVEGWAWLRVADELPEQLSPFLYPRLLALLKSSSAGVLSSLLQYIGMLGEAHSEPFLLDLLGHRDDSVRAAAATGLKYCGTSDAVMPLQDACAREDASATRSVMTLALRQIQSRFVGVGDGALSLCESPEGGLSVAAEEGPIEGGVSIAEEAEA